MAKITQESLAFVSKIAELSRKLHCSKVELAQRIGVSLPTLRTAEMGQEVRPKFYDAVEHLLAQGVVAAPPPAATPMPAPTPIPEASAALEIYQRIQRDNAELYRIARDALAVAARTKPEDDPAIARIIARNAVIARNAARALERPHTIALQREIMRMQAQGILRDQGMARVEPFRAGAGPYVKYILDAYDRGSICLENDDPVTLPDEEVPTL